MIKSILVLILLFTSCSSMSRSWGEWKVASVPLNEKTWNFCREERDGPELHGKGICFQDQECRYKKTLIGRTKSECRNKVLFCKWGDIPCLKKYNIFFNTIVNEGVLQ